MELLKKYFELQKQIHDYFGYVEDWKVIPLSDATNQYWFIDGNSVIFADEPITEQIMEDGAYYSCEIYTQRFLPKYVYRGEDYTMVSADTHTDGNKLLMVFDNKLECKNTDALCSYY